MGLSIGFSRDRYDDGCSKQHEPTPLPNPNPSRYTIIMHVQTEGYLLVLINYPDCTNYEGNKVLLYRGVTYSQLSKQKMIDPHFSENLKYASPLARFAPTSDGWGAALKLMEALQ